MSGNGKSRIRLSDAVEVVKTSLKEQLLSLHDQIERLEARKESIENQLQNLSGISAYPLLPRRVTKRKVARRKKGKGDATKHNGKLTWVGAAKSVMTRGERVPSKELFRRITKAKLYNASGKAGLRRMVVALSHSSSMKYTKGEGWHMGRSS